MRTLINGILAGFCAGLILILLIIGIIMLVKLGGLCAIILLFCVVTGAIGGLIAYLTAV